MGDARWQRARAIFEAALDLPEHEREAYVTAACGDDAELRAEVEALLDHDAAAPEGFVEPPPQPESADSVGLRLGGFTLVRELGRGAMGIVYLARQESLGREVAVKVFAERLTTTEAELERFHREARAAGKLEHPNIAKVLVDGTDGDLHWFAMELVPGRNLQIELALQRGEPTAKGLAPLLPRPGEPRHVKVVADLVASVAEALHHAHERGVIHRDVKPSNLLVTPDREVKVVDFGIARDESFGTLTQTDQLVGSLPYMSPEQARVFENPVDRRTDVYSLGVVLYELLTLERPFEGSTSHEVIMKLRNQEPRRVRVRNELVPGDLETICGKAMSKVPDERYASAGALADDLRRFLDHEAIEARPPSAWARIRRHARRHRVLLGGGLAVLAALGSGWAARRALFPSPRAPRVDVTAVDASGKPLAGRAGWRLLDPITAVASDFVSVGDLPVHGAILPVGRVRIVVDVVGFGIREEVRELELNMQLSVELVTRDQGPDDRMVRIPGGVLRVRGTPLSPLDGRDIEVRPFWMDECEVSIGEYRAFLDANPDIEVPYYMDEVERGSPAEDLPVMFVAWEDACAYAAWRGKRLPSHAEWMIAALGEEMRTRPWSTGETYLGPRGRTDLARGDLDAHFAHFLRSAVPVRSFPEARTPEGLYHMLGNVMEWTESHVADLTEEVPRPLYDRRVVCGGWWTAETDKPVLTRIANRGTGKLERFLTQGFRCARSDSLE